MDNDIRPDRQIHLQKTDAQFAAKLAEVKKEPLDHVVALDRHTGDVTVSSFTDVFQARAYEKSLPPNLVKFEDEGDAKADDTQVQGFVHHVEASLKPFDPQPHLQRTLDQIGKLRQDLNEEGNMNLRRFLLDRLQEVENQSRALLQSNPALAGSTDQVPLRQSLWAVGELGRMMVVSETFGIRPVHGFPEGPQWPAGQPTPTWNREFSQVIDAAIQQGPSPRDRQLGLSLAELAKTTGHVLELLAQN